MRLGELEESPDMIKSYSQLLPYLIAVIAYICGSLYTKYISLWSKNGIKQENNKKSG